MASGEPYPLLSDLQLSVLRVLWRRGELPVSEVHAALRERGLAQTTVATLLRRLEKREVVTHRREGRQFLYSATVGEEQAQRSMLSEVTERLFAGDVTELLNQLLSAREIASGDIARIRALLEAKERELGGE